MAALARPKEWVGLVTFSFGATSPSPSSTSWPFQDHHCCFVPLSAATSTPAPKFTLITPRRALFMRIFNVRPAVTCIHHRTHHKSCKANSQKTLGVKKVANCQTSSIKVDQKFKFWRAKIFYKRCCQVQRVNACICQSAAFTNSGKHKYKFTNSGKYKYKFTNTGMSHSQRLPGARPGCRMWTKAI